jgi:uncharacterized protein
MEADQLDITLADHDGRLELPPRGAELQLALGWHGRGPDRPRQLHRRRGRAHRRPDVLSLRARSADMRDRSARQALTELGRHQCGDIIATIAGRHELEPKVGDQLGGILLDHIDQTDESDMHFLTRLAERYDAVATVKAGLLLFTTAGQATTASGSRSRRCTLTGRTATATATPSPTATASAASGLLARPRPRRAAKR